jgi:hypothetical protein
MVSTGQIRKCAAKAGDKCAEIDVVAEQLAQDFNVGAFHNHKVGV